MSALAALPLSVRWSVAQAATQMLGLSDPAFQDKFLNQVPDAMAPGFKYVADKAGNYKVHIREAMQFTGLKDIYGNPVATPVWGYSDRNAKSKVATWPGKTFEVQSVSAGGRPQTQVKWQNRLSSPFQHLLPVDTNAHWCYSLPGYEDYTIADNGVPTITHLHGGHSDFQFDGNPEFFSSPESEIVGPQWANVPGGYTEKFLYDNNVRAGNLWYHDHALGITRLNVYAGLAGFYFVRDEFDTGKEDNPLGLPAWPYEKAYAIQDRMFRDTGELFYPAYPDEPFYNDFIFGEGAILPPELFPDGGPSALAEFFGDHMVVNGVLWPKEDVEQRNYRFRLLNGTDSRFMGLQFRPVAADATDLTNAGAPLDFWVIGSDQGLSSEAVMVKQLMFEPGSRYDVVVDFSQVPTGSRVIMENYLGDAPFGGDLPDLDPEVGDIFFDRQTDRVMAFDVVPNTGARDDFNPGAIAFGPTVGDTTAPKRKVALFEGKDEFGRLQPLLGALNAVTGEFDAIPWHMATTENPALNSTEEWEIYNFTGDAHPVHLHLVHFEVLGRRVMTFDADEDVNPQAILQHNGSWGMAPRVSNVKVRGRVKLGPDDGFVENAPKDMVTALPGQVTRIKATFDKPGRYVWHCHILSHEDHEMMRVLHVGDGA
jgi:FtsP/CotA-like multicopper oxidase with cupredoxin domain